MLFDQAHQAHQQALDRAFADGARYGSEQSDADLMAECVDLRVQLKRMAVRLERREDLRATLLNFACAGVVVACWALIAVAVVWVS